MESTSTIETSAQEWLDTPIGNIEGDMLIKDHFMARLKDNTYTEFINKVQMDAAKVDISNVAIFDNHRKGFKHNVIMRDIIANYKYPNALKVISLKGSNIKDALEKTSEYFYIVNGKLEVCMDGVYPKLKHYNYDMWEGDYAVVMNNYRAGGGGNYQMFKGRPVLKDISIDMAELIANYILERKKQNIIIIIDYNKYSELFNQYLR